MFRTPACEPGLRREQRLVGIAEERDRRIAADRTTYLSPGFAAVRYESTMSFRAPATRFFAYGQSAWASAWTFRSWMRWSLATSTTTPPTSGRALNVSSCVVRVVRSVAVPSGRRLESVRMTVLTPVSVLSAGAVPIVCTWLHVAPRLGDAQRERVVRSKAPFAPLTRM